MPRAVYNTEVEACKVSFSPGCLTFLLSQTRLKQVSNSYRCEIGPINTSSFKLLLSISFLIVSLKLNGHRIAFSGEGGC